MSKAYAPNANFDGADFTNAVLDRVVFDGECLSARRTGIGPSPSDPMLVGAGERLRIRLLLRLPGLPSRVEPEGGAVRQRGHHGLHLRRG